MNLRLEVSNNTFTATYPDQEKNNILVNEIYSISKPITTSNGYQYIAVRYGGDEFYKSTSYFALIKLREDIDMGGSCDENYVLFCEEDHPDYYFVFKIE